MSAVDRVFAGLVVTLLGVAALLQPLWRRVDPRPAQVIAAREAFRAGAEVDPWGTPWSRSALIVPGQAPVGVSSAGPDRAHQAGGGDDVWVGLEHDGVFAGTFDPRPERHVRAYERGPAVPLALAVGLLLTRLLSSWWPAGRTRAARIGAAAALALIPFAKTFLAAQGLGILTDLTTAAGAVALPPALAAGGTIYALTFALVYAHRELGANDVAPAPEPTTGP